MAEKRYMGPISLEELASLIQADLKKDSLDDSVVAEAIKSYLAQNPIEYSLLKGKPEPIRNSQLEEVLK